MSKSIVPKKAPKKVSEILAIKAAAEEKRLKILSESGAFGLPVAEKTAEEKFNEKLIGGFNLYASRHRDVFALASPTMLTVKDRKGQYKKHAFVGGDCFVPTSIYMGKRGKFIFVFTPTAPGGFATMEIVENEVDAHLPEFKAYFEAAKRAIFGDDFASSDSVIQEEHQQKQQNESKNRYEDNPLFASW